MDDNATQPYIQFPPYNLKYLPAYQMYHTLCKTKDIMKRVVMYVEFI